MGKRIVPFGYPRCRSFSRLYGNRYNDTVYGGEAVLKDWIKKIPLRRMGKPVEIADAIMFIIKNDFINGKVIEIDGGLRM